MALVAKPPNAWKPPQRIVQFVQFNPILSDHDPTTAALIDAAWENRANLSAQSRPSEVTAMPSTQVIAELDSRRLRVATREAWASGPCTSGSRRPCCCLPPERQRSHARR
jgi:hypothetical protein